MIDIGARSAALPMPVSDTVEPEISAVSVGGTAIPANVPLTELADRTV